MTKHNVCRRDFLAGSLTSVGSMILPCSAFGKSEEKIMSFGVVSDVHVDRTPLIAPDLTSVFRYFDANGVDAVMVPGDLADSGLICEMERFAEIWNSVFPNDRGADGRHVEKLLVTGNHCLDGWHGRWDGWSEEKLLAESENEAEQATCECDDQPAFPKEQDREKNMASEAEVPQTVTDTTVPDSGLNFDGIDTREDLASVMADIDEKLPIKRGRHSAVKQESIEPEAEKGETPIITEKVKKSENSTEKVNAGEYVPTEEEILAYIEKLMSEEH